MKSANIYGLPEAKSGDELGVDPISTHLVQFQVFGGTAIHLPLTFTFLIIFNNLISSCELNLAPVLN